MKWPRPRLTIRRMMIAVLGLGIVLHLSVATWHAYRTGGNHLHFSIQDAAYSPSWVTSIRRQPSLSTFFRLATGWSWTDRRSCWIGPPMMMEMCELDNPEIRQPLGPNTFVPIPTKAQREFFEARRLATLAANATPRKQTLLEKVTALFCKAPAGH